MQIITKGEYKQKRERLIQQIAQGALFIFPSDTIYRVGCDATNSQAVKQLRALKKTTMPFSVIAPSKQWIRQHCIVNEEGEEALDLLPDRYVLIMDLRNKNAISQHVTNGLDAVGVRIPRNWTQEIATLLNRPLVTTTANVAGGSPMTSLDNIPSALRKKITFCLDGGEIPLRSINVIDLRKNQA
ncbi:hypothetical protein GF342_03670 [Candidatus Woesearchaeota archaeon]|nr:hypothetical protein [Candidatus Woesearchaeota archaeon]